MSRTLAAALLLSLGLAAPLAAQLAPASPKAQAAAPASAGGPAWNELKPAQQAALAPLKDHWAGIDANRKTKWLAVAQRFGTMTPAERQRTQTRMAEWAALTPGERGRARQNFQELRGLRTDDRRAMWEAYKALPPDKKRELAQRARPATVAPRPADGSASGSAGRRVAPVAQAQMTVRPVTPTVLQAKPGASTTLVTKSSPTPPAHHQPGLPKIAATEGFVNPSTLLPSRGPQGAATLVPLPATATAATAAASAARAAASAPAAAHAPASAAASEPGL
ncbi:MAG: DUF3106 domain-containing protein [Rubrivivax sp.]